MNKELLRVRTLLYTSEKNGVQLLSHYLQECTEKRVEYFTCNVDE